MSCQHPALPQPAPLLSELQAVIPQLESRATAEASVWHLHLGLHLVRLRWLANPARLELALEVGHLPADAPVALYQALLAYNGVAALNRSTRVVTEGTDPTLWLLCDLPAAECSATELQAALLDLIDAGQSVRIWLHVQLDHQLATVEEVLAIH